MILQVLPFINHIVYLQIFFSLHLWMCVRDSLMKCVRSRTLDRPTDLFISGELCARGENLFWKFDIFQFPLPTLPFDGDWLTCLFATKKKEGKNDQNSAQIFHVPYSPTNTYIRTLVGAVAKWKICKWNCCSMSKRTHFLPWVCEGWLTFFGVVIPFPCR